MAASHRAFTLELPPEPLSVGQLFIRQVRFRLRDDFLVKITEAVAGLSDERIWWRPNDASNSVGNLLLHLAGNARQWLSAGVGGAPDVRRRPQEFAARTGGGKDELLAQLTAAVSEADAVLAALAAELAAASSDQPLLRECEPQGFRLTVLDALFQCVEHFAYHTGQIVYIAKLHTGDAVRFYDDRELSRE